MLSDLRKMRLLCGLRQIEVAFCTGVSVSALAAAESGRKPLTGIEQSIVVSFLKDHWQLLELAEKNHRHARAAMSAQEGRDATPDPIDKSRKGSQP
jgi:hypothetical protein